MDIQKLCVILRKNLYPEHVLNKLIHRYISRAVKGDGARPSVGVELQELPQFYLPGSQVKHSKGCANLSIYFANLLTSNLLSLLSFK